MAMTISIDDDLKREFSEVCREIGLPPSTAIGLFARAVVRDRAIPFRLAAPNARVTGDEAYESAVSEGIRRGLAEVSVGDVVTREESRARRDRENAR